MIELVTISTTTPGGGLSRRWRWQESLARANSVARQSRQRHPVVPWPGQVSSKANRLPLAAIACALSLPLIALIVHPSVELGINDDWSYIRSAQVLAQTGHIVYNGWAAPMLGWQLFLGAAFIKVFGFSFLVLRAVTILIATLTAFLFHRILVRCGVNEFNSSIGTLTLTLSPLFLPLTFSFMTDIGGLLVILLCLYGCLRALTAHSVRAILTWLCLASLSNVIGGTIRQIAWLGVLVMVPSTFWLLRRRHPRLVLAGISLLFASVGLIYMSLRWFAQQRFNVQAGLILGPISRQAIIHLAVNLFRVVLELPFFLLPVLLLFVPALRNTRRALQLVSVVASFAFLIFFVLQHQSPQLSKYCLFPYLGNYVTVYGLMGATTIEGVRPIVLTTLVRILLTAVSLLAALVFFIFVVSPGSWRESTPASRVELSGTEPAIISCRAISFLLIPFTVAYVALLIPRAAFASIFDRYLLVLIAISVIPILRLYQHQVWPLARLRKRAVVLSLPVLFIFAAAAIAGTHDLFSLFRAQAAAINKLLASGVPPTLVDGGFEFNGWTQIVQTGFVGDPRPLSGAVVRYPAIPCEPRMGFLFPSLTPRYALSFQPGLCQGSADFPPVPYDTWLPRRRSFVYTIKVRVPSSD
jgi:hypothetical protein